MAPPASLPIHRPLRSLGSAPLDFETLWEGGQTFSEFLNQVRHHPSLWLGNYRHAAVPAWALLEFGTLPRGLRLLVLNADWCLDSAATVPLLARLAEQVRHVELRLLERDEYPEVMDRFLTDDTRSIPLVILLDQQFRPLGHWGPRPAPLQAWVRANLETLPKDERLREQRLWYIRDRGETTLREILDAVKSEDRFLSEATSTGD